MRDDCNTRTEDAKCVRGRWLKHDIYTHETYFNGKWYAEEDWPALVDAVERDEYERDEEAEARMMYQDMRRSAGEPD